MLDATKLQLLFYRRKEELRTCKYFTNVLSKEDGISQQCTGEKTANVTSGKTQSFILTTCKLMLTS